MTPSREVGVTFAADEPAGLARFWAALLGRELVDDGLGLRLPGYDGQVGLRFVAGAVPKTGPNRMHLHLTSDSAEQQREIVATALRLGGRPADVGQSEQEEHEVLADPEGNELCVIEPGNSFLAGCGLLGELACEGSRAVGVFWSRVLDWPLVWDQDEETAVQSPVGGTKVAWGGPAPAPPVETARLRLTLVLVGGDLSAEVDRLVQLGATRRDGNDGGTIRLADPDGTVFDVVALRSSPAR